MKRARVAPIVFALLGGCSQSTGVATDADMVRHFTGHRGDFERLATMVKADKRLQHVARDSVAPADALPEPRLREYRDLLTRLNLGRLSNVDGAVKFTTAGTHMLSYDKGYLHAPQAPAPLQDSLDVKISELKPFAQLYKRLEGDWYLYFHNPWD